MDIFEFYKIALEEGEGLGTAYEYSIKQRLLRRHCPPYARYSLIYGLPERYGYASDLFIFLDSIGSSIDLYEEDDGKVKKARAILNNYGITFRRVRQLSRRYDVILSSEFFHRISSKESIRICNELTRQSDMCVIFVPNGDNELHSGVSGLKGMRYNEICNRFEGSAIIPLDCPPFPPGIRTSRNQKRVLLLPLFILSLMEGIYPRRLMRRKSHIYAIIPKG